MNLRSPALGLTLCVAAVSTSSAQPPPTSAKVDTQPLVLTQPDRYNVPTVLEPVRRVTLVATADGIVRSQDARAGTDVRSGQPVAELDKSEAMARVKIAQAEAKEHQVLLEGTPRESTAIAKARLDAAQARVELAQGALERCTLRAPFAGRVMASHVSDGQFVAKGTVIAELADVSSLRSMVPLARAGATVGGTVPVVVEGQTLQAKVQALLPLPPEQSVLRELASPLAAAWVVLPNPSGALEPGQRVQSPAVPSAPIASVPAQAVHNADGKAAGATFVQVIRNEYVTNVTVRALGSPGPDRLQVTGPLRPTDGLIISSSVPLQTGTLIRFAGSTAAAVEGTTPNPGVSGEAVDLTPPAAAGSRGTPYRKPASPPAAPPPGPAGGAGGKPSVPF